MFKIIDLVESRRQDAGGDFNKGADRAAAMLLEMLHVKPDLRLIQPNELSVGELFEAFVIRKLLAEGKPVAAILSGEAVAIAEAVNTTQFPRILSRMAELNILDNYELALEGADALVTNVDIKGTFAYFQRITGKDLPELVHEGHAYEETAMGEWECVIKARKYGRLLKITKEMIMEDRTGDILQNASDFGLELGYHRQTEIFEACSMRASTIHGGGTTDIFKVNGTGYAIYADTHATVPGSGGHANDNNITSASMDSDGLSAALLKLRKVVNIHGIPLRIRASQVLVAPETEESAWKMFNFDNTPGATSQADKNIHKGRFTPFMDPDNPNTYWYMGDFPRQMRYVWAWHPTIRNVSPVEMSLTHDIVLLIQASYKGGCAAVDHRFAVRAAL